MKSFLKCFLLAGLLLPATLWGATGITDLRVQDQVHPLAIEDLHPLFSWRMESDKVGECQTAYQIMVRRAADGRVMWTSGRVERGESNNIAYGGVALQP
ncbi:MAG: hypothetical protein IKN19_06785, partial [Bacteroidaceae bacterium]|nr:hypothetical protein [Bacteroidaceae bacterium]